MSSPHVADCDGVLSERPAPCLHVVDDAATVLMALSDALDGRMLVRPLDTRATQHIAPRLIAVADPGPATVDTLQDRFPSAFVLRVCGSEGVQARLTAPRPRSAEDAAATTGPPTLVVDGAGHVIVESWPRLNVDDPRQDVTDTLLAALQPPPVPSTSLSAGIYGRSTPELPEDTATVQTVYAQALALAVESTVYRDTQPSQQRDLLRKVARWIRRNEGGPRDVVELHTRVLDTFLAALPAQARPKAVEESRLVILELMGHLVIAYRDQAVRAAES